MMTNEELNRRFRLQKEYLGGNKPVNKIDPLVTVSVTTYQHGAYIQECLDGILMQKTSFPFEVIVGEDGSVDDTAEICKQYADKYPNKIRLFLRDRTISHYINEFGKDRMLNATFQRMHTRGKYYAACEGDDYWLDPYKLQKQVDFLEANPGYVLIHTDYNYKNQETGKITEAIHTLQGDIPDEEENCAPYIISDRYHIATCTALYRMEEGRHIDELYAEDFDERYLMGDYQKWFHLARLGKVKYLEDVTATYRRNDGSATAFFDNKKRLVFIENVYWQRRTFAERYGYPEQLPIIHFRYLRNLAFLKYRINGHNKNNEYYRKFKALENVCLLLGSNSKQ